MTHGYPTTITEHTTTWGTTQLKIVTRHYAIAARYWRARALAEAIVDLIEACPDGYEVLYHVPRRGSMSTNPTFQVTGPSYQSIKAEDPRTLIPHVQHAVHGQQARIDRANDTAARAAADQIERDLATQAEQVRDELGLATPKQVSYIMRLLATRARSGDGGGFFAGPTTIEDVRAMTKSDASTYITSLTERY
jgi:hypothetical protein